MASPDLLTRTYPWLARVLIIINTIIIIIITVVIIITTVVVHANRSWWACRYASMQGQAKSHRALQLCATTSVAGGKALWSGPVQLNALGAAAVLEVPCPLQPVHNRKDKLPGYRVAVTAVQVHH